MELKTLTIVFFVVLINCVFCDLRPGDPAVCPFTDLRLPKYRVVNVTYACADGKVCQRTKQQRVETTMYICCDKYKLCYDKCILEDAVCAELECVNAKYNGSKGCTCDPGLEHLNETHCGPPCLEGFYNDLTTAKFTCKSKCREPCVNGNCTDFDKCTCNPGLVNLNTTHCGPLCLEGFYNDLTIADFTCKSKCSEPCVNGNCTDFDKCTCNPGLVNLNTTHCGPLCLEGFYNDLTTADFTCKSKCSEPCVNGNCTDFDKCTCNPGLVNLNTTHCGPLCLEGFYNDLTTADFICKPKCSKPCVNGNCTDFDICTCDPGLVHLNDTHCGPSCLEGFYNDLLTVDFTCKSKCSKPCVNGNCVDFDECTCDSGYKLLNGSQYECEPECDACINGVCVAPDNCNCNTGYIKYYNEICVPVCTDPCINGYCVAPDNCKCVSGYIYDQDIKSCVAACNASCINSTCVVPDRCECWSGFVSSTDPTICKPYCTTCSDGECIKPDVCLCNEGFQLKNGTCKPVPIIAGLPWILVTVTLIVVLITIVVIYKIRSLRKKSEQKDTDRSYNVLYSASNTKNDHDINNTETLLSRASSQDYIEKL
ncbi:hypothetical protein evm_009525 [Chilo suppressalis]|nr:hypothetical protein evm_009525 [Chilo suppressalis]